MEKKCVTESLIRELPENLKGTTIPEEINNESTFEPQDINRGGHLYNTKNVRGDESHAWGNAKNIRGDISFVHGEISRLKGDVTGLMGLYTGVICNLDTLNIPQYKRDEGFHLSEVAPDYETIILNN